MSRTSAKSARPVAVSSATPPLTSATLGWVTALTCDGAHGSVVHVDFAGSPSGPQPARVAFTASTDRIAEAIATKQQAVLVFENGDVTRPIITGLIAPVVVPAASNSDAGTPEVLEADIDGRRVKLMAKDEIVLECGHASITLRRNGRVVIRGTYVETASDGTNRIKGGQVQIN